MANARTSRLLALFLALALLPGAAFAAATITVVNMDGPGEGFNDPTAVAPVGGNPGLTRGAQRLIAFQHAANIWGAVLDSPETIYVQASFDPLTCTATAATLGAAGAIQIFANFPGREFDDMWYHVALANKLAGGDLAPGPNGTSADDIVAFFNSRLNGDLTCLGGRKFYLGLDANHGTDIDLVTVLLHEFGHGLGFANFVTEATGSRPLGLEDIFSEYTVDVSTGKRWNEMTTAELVASAINSRKVVWDGLHVTDAIPGVLAFGTPLLTVNSPAGLGPYDVGSASFGPPITAPGTTGNLVQALDPADVAGPTTFDACSPITNAAAVAGNIALVDRGTCGFIVKVKNAQDAGATAVIVADNAVGSPPAGLGGADPTIIIPSARVTQADGNTLKTALGSGTVNVTLGVDLSVRAGTEATTGLAHLNAPNPVQPGSSISHWDPIAFPNQLMEPAINGDLTHSVQPPEDLTLDEMTDIGWFSDGDGVPDGRDACLGSTATVVIDGCDSGVANDVFADGCTISDAVNACAAGAANHGAFVSCVTKATNDFKKQGLLTGAEKDAIQGCAAGANIP
ncbi:MAG TPA: PA domain-containing protein [Thermoanaerobaculia bacterium]